MGESVLMTKRPRRRFALEYKAEVVRLCRESDKSIGVICREMDLPETAVRRWVRQAEVDAGGGKPDLLTTEERSELTTLRRENKRLRLEREIPKKATAFFARENS